MPQSYLSTNLSNGRTVFSLLKDTHFEVGVVINFFCDFWRLWPKFEKTQRQQNIELLSVIVNFRFDTSTFFLAIKFKFFKDIRSAVIIPMILSGKVFMLYLQAVQDLGRRVANEASLKF